MNQSIPEVPKVQDFFLNQSRVVHIPSGDEEYIKETQFLRAVIEWAKEYKSNASRESSD